MFSIRHFLLTLLVLSLGSCQQTSQQAVNTQKDSIPSTGNFGQPASAQNAVAVSQIMTLFTNSDTVEVTLTGDIAASCKHSGCWMDLDMGNQETVHVTFKDEAFTIPLDAAGKHAVAQGIAIRELIPVETLQNYAREEGKNEEEIAKITEPAWTYEMVATGVLIEE
jgi:hypothetical protein